MHITTKVKRTLALLMALLMFISAASFAETGNVDFSDPSLIQDEHDDSLIPDTEEITPEEIQESEPFPENEDTPPSEDIGITEEPPVAPEEPTAEPIPVPEDEPVIEEPIPLEHLDLVNALMIHSFAHVMTVGDAKLYTTPNMAEQDHVFTICKDSVLLVTEYVPETNCFGVWFIMETYEAVSGYVSAEVLAETVLLEDEVNALTYEKGCALLPTEVGELIVFVAYGELPTIETPEVPTEEPPAEELPEESEELQQETTDEHVEESPIMEPYIAQIGDFVAVTTTTRAFMGVDDTASESYAGDLSLGYFVRDAAVQVEAVETDSFGRTWYKVRHMYGDDFADGTLKWTEYGIVYVLAEEAYATDVQDFTITDYAFHTIPPASLRSGLSRAASPMNGFSLKSINVPIGTFYAGQSGIYGSSGKDSDYLQIASAAGHGTVYATPHYLDGFTVYCLEHTLPGPGERISGGGNQPTGPYVLVDIDSYMNTPGYSGAIFKSSTMHAIGWVLRHTYPFMVLDRNDSDNETWSRVAGQFAIREVIKQLEGSQYVRSYWDMSNFYNASGQAPGVYLTYARWLAENGIARAGITGNITVSNKSVTYANDSFIGTMRLTTDADLMRIKKGSVSVAGNSAGSDSSYYYLNSGDTVTVTSSVNGFSVKIESMSSADEEANFLIGVPSVAIQKVLIPLYGTPQKLKEITVQFEKVILYGDLIITKTRDRGSKQALAGAKFQLYDSTGAAYGNPVTTNAKGEAKWSQLRYGTYYVQEIDAPTGYQVDVNKHTIKIENPTNAINFPDKPIFGSVRLVKKASDRDIPLKGAKYELVTKSASGYVRAKSVVDGSDLPILTTGADGSATWNNVVEYGEYYVHEVEAPQGYLIDDGYYPVSITQQATVEVANVKDAPVKVKLKLYKRDDEEYKNVSDTSTRGDAILTGAEFQVLAGEDIAAGQGGIAHKKGAVVIESLKTAGDDASVTTGELWPGLYEIIEIKPPTGYQPSEESIFVDAREAALQSSEAVILYEGIKTNTVLYGLYSIVKFMGDNEVHDDAGIIETPEEGAEFEFYLKSAGSYENARDFERDYLTTNEYGHAVTKLVPYGLYVLKQVKGAEGHAIKSPVDIFIRGTENPDSPPILIINNEAIRFRLKFIKVDAETGNTITLAGTSFKLKDSKGEYVTQTMHYPSTVTMDTFVTDENGEVTLPETVTYGMYYLEEITSPDGYLILTEEYGVFVGDENMNQPGEAYLLEFEIPNEPVRGNIILEKKGLQLTGFQPRTDAYGNEYQQPMYEEKYLEDAVFEVRAAEDIAGKEGTVWYQQDELVDTITTTASGADASKTLPLGKYYLVEISAPEGYAFEDTRHPVELRFHDNQTALVETKITVGNEYLPAEISLKKEIEATQILSDDAGMVKQTIAVTAGEGFVFGLYSGTSIQYSGGILRSDTLVATGVTGTDGSLTFSGRYPHGEYYIKELSAPNGWMMTDARFDVSITPHNKAENAAIIRVRLTEPILNELIYTTITLSKKDITGENTLPGALIEVRNEAGEIIYRAYTDENGYIPDIPITPGKYTFHEVWAPDGYALNEATMTFTVDAEGNITGDTTIHDDYTRFSILKHDESGYPLAGVEFLLVNADKSFQLTAVSDESGLVTFEKVPYGSYTITETSPPEGYEASETVVELTIDGSFVNPTKPIATIVNYPVPEEEPEDEEEPDIQTGFDYAITPVMWAGAGLVLVGIGMLVKHCLTRKKHKKRRR